jgi:hypothetical protein
MLRTKAERSLLDREPSEFSECGDMAFMHSSKFRAHLPDSLELMLSFIYLAYSMMALLTESGPCFRKTWIECLGELARYRMAIEVIDLRNRELWCSVARMWYNEAASQSRDVGRIQHHLAVPARPNIVQELLPSCWAYSMPTLCLWRSWLTIIGSTTAKSWSVSSLSAMPESR